MKLSFLLQNSRKLFLFVFFIALQSTAYAQKPEDLGIADVDTFVNRSFKLEEEHKTFSGEIKAVSDALGALKGIKISREKFEEIQKEVEKLQQKGDKLNNNVNQVSESGNQLQEYYKSKAEGMEDELKSIPMTNLKAIKAKKDEIAQNGKAVKTNIPAGAGAVSRTAKALTGDLARLNEILEEMKSLEVE
ncbi:MAG TPA: hypothetical protein DCM08_00250 [Microscillaceae bacterium]|jgi:phage host-nuclease inhibitor protein Gam|nr:hypothetical protein [Microscillaceae bacterium]